MLSSFFFQAEDGIRVLTVTGVQTCALPILSRQSVSGMRHAKARLSVTGTSRAKADLARRSVRSEERRVGKSVDFGGSRRLKLNERQLTVEVRTQTLHLQARIRLVPGPALLL